MADLKRRTLDWIDERLGGGGSSGGVLGKKRFGLSSLGEWPTGDSNSGAKTGKSEKLAAVDGGSRLGIVFCHKYSVASGWGWNG